MNLYISVFKIYSNQFGPRFIIEMVGLDRLVARLASWKPLSNRQLPFIRLQNSFDLLLS